jgi:hypothetical protein
MIRNTTRKTANISSFTCFKGSLAELQDRILKTKSEQLKSYLNNEWTGDSFASLDDAITKIETGDPALFEQYQLQERKVTAKPNYTTKQNYIQDEEGLYYDINLYMEGESEYWFRQEDEPIQGKHIDLYINTCLSGGTTTQQVYQKLINIVYFIDSAEANGDRVNIFLCEQTRPGTGNPHQEKLFFEVKIKDQSQPLNRQQLIYLIATPVLSRFAFLLLASERHGVNAGACNQCDKEELQRIKDKSIIYIPSFYYDSRNGIDSYSDLKRIYPHLRDHL